MKTIIVSALTLTSILTGLSAQASGSFSFDRSTRAAVAVENVSEVKGATFVRTGHDSGYYVVAPGSSAINTLGLQHAPYVDADNVAQSGVGLDAITFRFGADGKLEGHPVYISQFAPDGFYTTRLQGLSSDRSTLALVRELFDGHTIRIEKQGTRTLAYLEVPVYSSTSSGS